MCRNFLLLGNGDKFTYLANYVNNSYEKYNNHGFFLAIDDKYTIRTLNFSEYINFIKSHKKDINSSFCIAGHLRLSTNKIHKDYIHGWKFKGFYCYHNGINSTKDKSEHDSLDFYKYVFRNKNYKFNLHNELKDRGSGAYFLINPEKKIFIFASRKHDINFHLINDKLLLVNSNDDIHEFNDYVGIKKSYTLDRFGIEFKREYTKKVLLPEININEDIKTTYDDAIIVLKYLGDDKYKSHIENLPKYAYKYEYNQYYGHL